MPEIEISPPASNNIFSLFTGAHRKLVAPGFDVVREILQPDGDIPAAALQDKPGA